MKDTYTMRQIFGALLAGLSKVFDCIPHELIIAKLQAYKHKNLSKTICQIENKELKSMAYIVRGKTYFLVFHRDPYCVFSFLIYTYVAYFTFWKT